MDCCIERDYIYPEQERNGRGTEGMVIEKDRVWSVMVKKGRNLVSKKEVGEWGKEQEENEKG